jgi:hypothetical protein
MIKLWLVLVLALPSLPIIAVIDNLVFGKFAKCPICGEKLKLNWYYWIIPTFIEFCLLALGIALGMAYILNINIGV